MVSLALMHSAPINVTLTPTQTLGSGRGTDRVKMLTKFNFLYFTHMQPENPIAIEACSAERSVEPTTTGGIALVSTVPS